MLNGNGDGARQLGQTEARARRGLNVDIIGRDHLDSDSTRQREFVEDALHRHPAK
jgi:hypothetical protein